MVDDSALAAIFGLRPGRMVASLLEDLAILDELEGCCKLRPCARNILQYSQELNKLDAIRRIAIAEKENRFSDIFQEMKDYGHAKDVSCAAVNAIICGAMDGQRQAIRHEMLRPGRLELYTGFVFRNMGDFDGRYIIDLYFLLDLPWRRSTSVQATGSIVEQFIATFNRRTHEFALIALVDLEFDYRMAKAVVRSGALNILIELAGDATASVEGGVSVPLAVFISDSLELRSPVIYSFLFGQLYLYVRAKIHKWMNEEDDNDDADGY